MIDLLIIFKILHKNITQKYYLRIFRINKTNKFEDKGNEIKNIYFLN
jgi:hypothetical protein